MTAPRTQLVLFDCDGVLVDSEPIALRLLLSTLAAAGVTLTPAEADALFLGRSLATTRAIVARDYGLEFSDAALDEMRRALYAAFRADRATLRAQGQPLDGHRLVGHLLRYSERGQGYIVFVRQIMQENRMSELDGARLPPL